MRRMLIVLAWLGFDAGTPLESSLYAQESPAAAAVMPETVAALTPPPDAAAAPLEPPPAAPPQSGDEDEARSDPLTPQKPEVKSELELRLKALDNAGLTEEDKQHAAEFYQQAIEAFDVANQQIDTARKFQKELDELPAGIQEYTEKLSRSLKPNEDVSGEPLAEVEKRAAKVEASFIRCSEQLALMKAEPKRRSQRMAELPTQIADAQAKLKQIADELAALGAEDLGNVLAVARRTALVQEEAAQRATLEALAREQQLYEEGAELIKLRRDYYARYVPHIEKRLAQRRAEINRRREAEARQQAQDAAQAAQAAQATGRPAAINELARENSQFADRRTKIAAGITDLSKQLDDNRKRLDKLRAQYKDAQEQARVDELADVIGHLLRRQQSELPNLRQLKRSKVMRESEQSRVQLEKYELYDQQAELANLDDLASQLAARCGDLSVETRGEIRQLLEARNEILGFLIQDYEKYSQHLYDLDSTEAQLISTTEEYAQFIAERVLWIRSCTPLSKADVPTGLQAAAWSLDPRRWTEAGGALLQAAGRQPGLFLLCFLGFAGLISVQRMARRRLQEVGAEAAKRGCSRLEPTLQAVWLTMVVAAPWPALLAFLGWALDSPLNQSEFVRSLSAALRFTAVCLLLLEVLRHLCRQGGLGEAHFDWPHGCTVQLRRKLRWLTVLGVPLVLWLVGLETQSERPLWSSSLGRANFIVAMGLLSVVMQRLLLAKGSPFRKLVLHTESGWLAPLQAVWRPTAVLLPVALAALAAVGYYYTAQQAAVRILQTAALLTLVLALGGLTRRWLLVNRRRLAREQAKLRRAQLAAAADADPAAPPSPDLADDAIDLAALSEKTQKLVRTFLSLTAAVGLALIWSEILPALAYPAEKVIPGAVALTWGQLAMFLIVLAVTYISVRDVPALLELVVLPYLPLDSGARYAFTTMCRYILGGIGLVAASSAIGLQWKNIQWLVAAMSVGLGFGLQEIFGNFVSGIILLFERPIRVGDIVTLGDKSGVVNRIRMRATTIVDWDHKEYIVPNKDLVTERLLNWTLSNSVNRVVVTVGVAYGSDTELACELLLEAAREQPHVLADPPPVSYLKGFGDSALQLELCCFLPNLDNRTTTIHQLHTAVDRKFRAAGLDIPYPQRDMRVRIDESVAAMFAGGKPKVFTSAAG